ncbi:MAG: HipA domain-containing protein [Lachnospiraceae bacterium]|nr:HipA domain-containing protein [Lachnospiraceae bacterium]
MQIIDFTNCILSERAGTYGGNAGFKDGIIYEGENWIIKYPKTTKGMRVDDISYTTSPLSEYIGSHVYDILGYDVHETLLGYRNEKIVVACKDFCRYEGELREIRTIKNLANPQLAEMLDRSFSSTDTGEQIDLDEILLHLKYNDILSQVAGITERFWDCVVIDILINNNDRNNGNWGVLRRDGSFILAPVFDNGAAFSTKASDEKLEKSLGNEERFLFDATNTVTRFSKNEEILTAKKMLSLEEEGLKIAIEKNVPVMERCFGEIEAMIMDIPSEAYGLYVCSDIRKEAYLKGMHARFDRLIAPMCRSMKGGK